MTKYMEFTKFMLKQTDAKNRNAGVELCKVVYKYVGESTERILEDLNDRLKQNLLNSFSSIEVIKGDDESKSFSFNTNADMEEEEENTNNNKVLE